MKILNTFPSFRDFNFEKITKPVSSLISSLYMKSAPYLSSFPTDTKLYKHPYVLIGISAIFISAFVVRRLVPSTNLDKEFQAASKDADSFLQFVKTYLYSKRGWTVTEDGKNVAFEVNVSYLFNTELKNAQISFTLAFNLQSKKWQIDYSSKSFITLPNQNFPFSTKEDLCTSDTLQGFVKDLILSKPHHYNGHTYSLHTTAIDCVSSKCGWTFSLKQKN